LGTLSRFNDAFRFLNDQTVAKDPTLRLLSWLVCLGLVPLPPGGAIRTLVGLYDEIRRANKSATASEVAIIDDALTRSVTWFRELAADAQLPDDRFIDSSTAAARILAQLSADGMLYVPGFDQFVWVSYLVCLQLAAAQNMPNSGAEALAFQLSRRLIDRSDIVRYARPDAATYLEFDELDFYVEKHFPRITESGQHSIFYALRWKCIWFCDQHALPNILPLWDTIIAHLNVSDG
jgi:hypothetical protein